FGGEGRLFRQLTNEENLALPLCYHRNCEPAQVRDRLDELLDWTGLTTFARRLPAQVSRSLWPRIALARALALQPELLFLDNPFRELDPPQRRWWLDFLGRLRSRAFSGEGRAMTIVAATDDLSPWIGPGERFALIADNQWRPIGGRAELSAFNEPLLRELLHDEG
ncbi:MAG: ATP-binding cassette domain-containing protein, partial [Verrucomicrobia bacterium]|nr:ATP-binding cassette domain-containing protein [Verrucomicrobiota bacterium]